MRLAPPILGRSMFSWRRYLRILRHHSNALFRRHIICTSAVGFEPTSCTASKAGAYPVRLRAHVTPAPGLEPGSTVPQTVRLSCYPMRAVGTAGFEPAIPGLSDRCDGRFATRPSRLHPHQDFIIQIPVSAHGRDSFLAMRPIVISNSIGNG